MRVRRGTPVLVPAAVVFGAAPPPRIFRASSSGAACHTGFHHAVLNGIYETVERDAFMLVWLNSLTLPRVNLDSGAPDPQGARRALAELRLRYDAVDITTDLKIPVILGVLRDELNPDLFLVNMVAALRPDALLGKLDRELVQFLHPYLADPGHFQSGLTRSTDPNAVKTFPDHLSFYQHRDKHRLASFLTASPIERPFGSGPFVPQLLPIRQELDQVLDRLARRGYEVIVVDCTPPFLRALGLYAVRVVIPGLQPLQAGHRYRVLGGSRVCQARRLLGLEDRTVSVADLNPWPHPFW
jgi:ribosomal protein S12 methylthiotransferase accessory factor